MFTGGLLGGLTYNDDLSQTALNTAMGMGGGLLGSKINMRKQGSRLSQRADELGIRLSPGEIYESDALKRFEAGLESFPLTTSAVSGRKIQNQKILNTLATKGLGEGGDTVTPEILDTAAQRIGDVFEESADGVSVALDDAFLNKLAAVDDAAQGTWIKSDPIGKVIDSALDEASKGPLSGKRYLQLSSMLGRKIRAWKRSSEVDPEDVFMLNDIKDALDDAFERSVPEDKLANLKEARNQWRNLSILETGNVTRETGDVSGPLLAGVLRRSDKPGYLRGRNSSDLYDAARISKAYPRLADSGTASRSMMMWLAGSNPATMIPKIGAGLVANPLARLYMYSPDMIEAMTRNLPRSVSIPASGLMDSDEPARQGLIQ